MDDLDNFIAQANQKYATDPKYVKKLAREQQTTLERELAELHGTTSRICPDTHQHARTLTCASAHKCQCAVCSAVWNAYHRWLRSQRKLGKLRGGSSVLSWPSQRRLQSLVAIGWSAPEIARRAGISQNNINGILSRSQITRAHAAQIDKVWRELRYQKPNPQSKSERISVHGALRRAKNNGWVPAICWDNIDDPDCVPDGGQPDSPGWVLEELEHFYQLGESPHNVSQLFPQSATSLARTADRHGRRDIARWIESAA